MFKDNIEALVAKLENLLSTKTIGGDPIVSGNVTIIPITSAGFGFGPGSGEGRETVKGGGGGGDIKPVALVLLQEGEIKV